jgi:ketopantoate reductase
MALKRGAKVERGYATIADEDGVNYREIAETMTELGFSMNHSSARNHVLRVMRKFAAALCEKYSMMIDESRIDEIAKSPEFQQGMSEILRAIELQRRSRHK